MTTIEAPRSKASKAKYQRSGRSGSNFEMLAWLFMRVSGVFLIVLIFGHLFVNLMLGEGVKQIDFAFVAGKWANPFWQYWALIMLWLAMLHGTNGVRTIINDYAERVSTRIALKSVLYIATVVIISLGTMVIFTFDPCIDAPGQLPAFCPAPQ
ncbi:succinate dehydrogenase hydrophobic membrane anchor subunit [Acaricomes phytoseiuli]|uniref:succinate dehydrogenase hydrophobic membrane anchor subunit n=1 Tax=Acaricomes phytoseiuli TaxID=291968 RepID=UPI000379D537|nr:succinate dehydrogenase hydrophobic membrane anchor subunit [Acaricomes phytoseiuli]MCW1248979.1 succinate dehydrogenase hydrophobic membrane anchor subunit [Acaricomes phytoseiuli]